MSGHIVRTLAIAALTAALTASGGLVPATASAERADASCPRSYPTPLGVETTDLNEVQYLDYILVCGSATGWILVRNNSDVVWAFHGGVGGRITKVEWKPAGALFAAAATRVYRYAYMAPGEAVTLPPRPSDVPRAASDVQWTIHPELSFMWLAQQELVDRVESTASTTVKDIIGNTRSKKAMVDCALAVWNTSAAAGGIVYGERDAASIWGAALGAGSEAGACAKSWKAAEKSKGRVKLPRYVDTVIAVGDNATLARQVTTAADDLTRYTNLFRTTVCALPKVPC